MKPMLPRIVAIHVANGAMQRSISFRSQFVVAILVEEA
jgi:hypothetical protein